MMKLIRITPFFSVILLLTLLIAGCRKPENPEPETEPDVILTIGQNTFLFGPEGGQQTLAVTSNATWSIDFSGIAWCRPSIQTTNGNANITISADPNPDEAERNGSFILKARGADDIVIAIIQDGKEPDPGTPDHPDYIKPDKTGMRELTSFEFANLMTIGWNLGNSLEAISVNNNVYTGSETTWGNPIVSRQLIDSVKAAGFNLIRIPVSWSHKLVDIPSHRISHDWLSRVEEVVNYALDNEMFVKINIHWDGGWMNRPFYNQQEAINEKITALWKQIAIHFRDYDDRLLFAGTNEVHEAGNYGTPTQENANVQNSFNQTFVNAVRATGGRNSYRHLVVQSYNTNIDHAVRFFVMPTDSTENRLIAEVHYYDPYDFALMETGNFKTQWGQPFAGGDVPNWGQEQWVHETFGKVKTLWIDRNTPVLLGEYGAILRSNLVGEALLKHIEARNYYLEYVTRTAIEYGMVPVYWDNGHTGNNGFGLFNRHTGAVVHKDALDALMAGAQNTDKK